MTRRPSVSLAPSRARVPAGSLACPASLRFCPTRMRPRGLFSSRSLRSLTAWSIHESAGPFAFPRASSK